MRPNEELNEKAKQTMFRVKRREASSATTATEVAAIGTQVGGGFVGGFTPGMVVAQAKGGAKG